MEVAYLKTKIILQIKLLSQQKMQSESQQNKIKLKQTKLK